jgi:pyruvate/oxaloacetate carboxyltransferase
MTDFLPIGRFLLYSEVQEKAGYLPEFTPESRAGIQAALEVVEEGFCKLWNDIEQYGHTPQVG